MSGPHDSPAPAPVPTPRAEAPSEGTIHRIEIDFATPVVLSDEDESALYDLVQRIAKANQPLGEVHWLFSVGHKPMLSQADARFMGKAVDPDAPESGEPTFDDSILYLETFCRERYDDK